MAATAASNVMKFFRSIPSSSVKIALCVLHQETPNEAATEVASFVLQASAVVESVAWCKAGCTGMARK
jgi:hypothetical protein